jgi:hypothetical protein
VTRAREVIRLTFPTCTADTVRTFRVIYEDGRIRSFTAEDSVAAIAEAQHDGVVRYLDSNPTNPK